MTTKQLTIWFSTISTILVLWGIVFAFFGLDILPVVDRAVLVPWVSALYGAIMIGWGLTLLLIGRVAFRRNDAELRMALLYGIALWLTVEGAFSAYFRIWFNVGVDVVVLALFSFPLLSASRSEESKSM
jgi:hypothetical protein